MTMKERYIKLLVASLEAPEDPMVPRSFFVDDGQDRMLITRDHEGSGWIVTDYTNGVFSYPKRLLLVEIRGASPEELWGGAQYFVGWVKDTELFFTDPETLDYIRNDDDLEVTVVWEE